MKSLPRKAKALPKARERHPIRVDAMNGPMFEFVRMREEAKKQKTERK